MIRFFDQESRKYLMHLNRQISQYEGTMIKLEDRGYKAPFKLEGIVIRKNMKMLQEIFKTQGGHIKTSELYSEAGSAYDAQTTKSPGDPIYFDELALSKFIEEYLEFMIPETFK